MLANTLIAQDTFAVAEAIGRDEDVEKGTMRPAQGKVHVPEVAR